MKRTFAWLSAIFLLLSITACSSTPTVLEMPSNAVLVFQQEFDKQSGINVAHGNWEAEGTGYFIVVVDFSKGNFKTMEIYDGNANNAVLLTLQKQDNSGMYQSDMYDMNNGYFGMRFKNLSNASGTISVFFVADENG